MEVRGACNFKRQETAASATTPTAARSRCRAGEWPTGAAGTYSAISYAGPSSNTTNATSSRDVASRCGLRVS